MTASADVGEGRDRGTTPVPSAPEVYPLARTPVAVVTGVVALVHLVAATRPRRWFDEALMLAIGRHHLDWGAADQPPVTPLLARAADLVAPGSGLALAVPAVIASAATVLVAALIARELGGDRRAQTLTALAQATGLWLAATGHWLIPFTLEPVFWLTIVWLVVRWVRLRDDRLLLALGVVVGVAAQTKLQIPMLFIVLIAAAAVTGPRDLLRRPCLWWGAGIALLIALPTVIWQATHGWPQLAVAASVSQQAFVFGGRTGIAIGLLVSAGPLALAMGAVGVVAAATEPRLRACRFLVVAFVVLFLLFVVPPGRPYYLAGMHAVIAAVGAVALQHRRLAGRGRRWRWLVWPTAALSAVLALGAVYLSVVGSSPHVADRVVETTASAWQALPPDVRGRTIVMGDSYIYSAYLDTAPAQAGLPSVYSGSVAYGYFPLPPDDRDAALFVELDQGAGTPALDRVRSLFAGARVVAEFRPAAQDARLYGGTAPTRVWLLSGREAPWKDVIAAARDI